MNTRNIFIIAAIAFSLTATNAYADAEDIDLSEIESYLDNTDFNIPRQKSERLPSPGIYKSEPYLTIVIVPESVDPAFEHNLGADTHIDDNVISPDTHLEPYQPDR